MADLCEVTTFRDGQEIACDREATTLILAEHEGPIGRCCDECATRWRTMPIYEVQRFAPERREGQGRKREQALRGRRVNPVFHTPDRRSLRIDRRGPDRRTDHPIGSED